MCSGSLKLQIMIEVMEKINQKISNNKFSENKKVVKEFINHLSHEIRTPINISLGLTEIILNSAVTINELNHYLGLIKNSNRQLLKIVDDLLIYTTITTKSISTCYKVFELKDSLIELLGEFSDYIACKTNTNVFLNLPEDPLKIFSDESLIIKIIRELIFNALKFTDKGVVSIDCYSINSKLYVQVIDSGVGINEEFHNHVFSPFSKENSEDFNKYTGLGLGLSIAKEYSNILGGKLSFQSVKNKGTIFQLKLSQYIS